jgi:hypothetical protein
MYASNINGNGNAPTRVTAVGTVLITATAVVAIYWVTSAISRQRRHRQNNNDQYTETFPCMDTSGNEDSAVPSNKLIYMDYNATTPIYAFVYQAMIPYLTTQYGNPGSAHIMGDVPSHAIRTARYQILHSVLQCPNVVAIADSDPTSKLDEHKVDSTSISSTMKTTTTPLSSCLFTSGGTEADNLMIHIALQVWTIRSNMQRSKRESSASTSLPSQQQPKSMMPHFVTTNVEHPAIETYLSTLEQQQHCTVTRVPVQAIDGRVTASDMITAIQSNTYAILYFLLLLTVVVVAWRFFLFCLLWKPFIVADSA